RLQLQRPDPGGIEADVATDAVAFDVSDVAPYRDIAAHALDAQRTLDVLDRHVSGHGLDLVRPAHAADAQVTVHRLGVDGAFARDGDVKVDTETLAAEEIDPAAFLLIEVGFYAELVAVLLHADIEVLEQTLRAVLARRAHALRRDDDDLARLPHADARLAGNVAHAQTRHALEGELA